MSDETRRGTARRAITEAKEREIRAWLADGSPMRQIAARVGVSIADVRRIAQAAAASSHSERMKRRWRKHGKVCAYCKNPVTTERGNNHPMSPSRDHVIPLSRGGRDSLDNIVMACRWCNNRKGSLDGEEFVAWLEGQASRLDMGRSYKWVTLTMPADAPTEG